MSQIPDGVYTIGLPFGGGNITDTGSGRYLNLLPSGSLGPSADQIKVVTSSQGSTLQFSQSGKYITYVDEPRMNNKLVTGDKPQYFSIAPHDYVETAMMIGVQEAKDFYLGPALERIYPPWVAMLSFPDKQAWNFTRVTGPKL